MPRKPWKTVSLLERLQEAFRAAPHRLTLDEVMAHLAPTLCEHGVEAELCLRLCEAPGRLEARIFTHCLESHGPYLKTQRPKWVRAKLEELIGLGLMHKEVSPQGFRYHAHEKLFDLFSGPSPAPEHHNLAELVAHHARSPKAVWYSEDPDAPRIVQSLPEAEYQACLRREQERTALRWKDSLGSDVSKQSATSANGGAKRERDEQSENARTRASQAERRAAFKRSRELAAALVRARKVACPFCGGRDHQVGMGDSHATGGAACSVSITCQACERHFYAVISTDNGDLMKVARQFACVVHPEFSCSSPGTRRALDHPGDEHWYQATKEEALADGWRSFYGVSKERRVHWICPSCLKPNHDHQRARRQERARRTGQLIGGRLHCPGCKGTNVRVESGLVRNRAYIEKEIALYGAYLYDEVYGVCLERWGRGGSDGGCPLYHLFMFDQLKLFYLPDGHRWRACSCGKHAEVPEHETSTRCACGKTLWLNYQDDVEGRPSEPT